MPSPEHQRPFKKEFAAAACHRHHPLEPERHGPIEIRFGIGAGLEIATRTHVRLEVVPRQSLRECWNRDRLAEFVRHCVHHQAWCHGLGRSHIVTNHPTPKIGG